MAVIEGLVLPHPDVSCEVRDLPDNCIHQLAGVLDQIDLMGSKAAIVFGRRLGLSDQTLLQISRNASPTRTLLQHLPFMEALNSENWAFSFRN